MTAAIYLIIALAAVALAVPPMLAGHHPHLPRRHR